MIWTDWSDVSVVWPGLSQPNCQPASCLIVPNYIPSPLVTRPARPASTEPQALHEVLTPIILRSSSPPLQETHHTRILHLGRAVHLHVEDCSEELLAPVILCHEEPARASKAPSWFFMAYTAAYDRTFPCMESNYPYAIKNQRGASKKTQWIKAHSRGLWMPELVLHGIRLLTSSTPRNFPRH